MKKNTISYIICWVMLLGLFNLICFLTPDEICGMSKYSGAFWTGYVFITISYIMHLIFILYMYSCKEQKQVVMNRILIIVSYPEIFLMTFVGAICMVVPGLPYWLGVIICYFVLTISVIFMMSFKIVGVNTAAANDELNQKTFNFRLLINDAEELMQRAINTETQCISKEIYETIRYSDLVSNPELYMEEQDISNKLNELKKIISDETKIEEVTILSKDLLLAIKSRNNKCKLLKNRK